MKKGMKYRKGTVRKNVTLFRDTAEALDRMSEFSGVTQSTVLERAMMHPQVARLRAFCAGPSGNPVVDLLDCVQGQLDKGQVSDGMCKALLGAFSEICLPVAELDGDAVSDWGLCGEVCGYVSAHIPLCYLGPGGRSAERDVMDGIHRSCMEGTWLCGDAGLMRGKLYEYTQAVMNDVDMLREPCFYRNLAMVLEKAYRCFPEDTVRKVYECVSCSEPDFFLVPSPN